MSRAHRAARSLAIGTAAVIISLAVPAASLASPLAGWWPMNEGKGQTVYDWSGNGNHGTLGSTPGADANDPTWTQGQLGSGRALAFDGNDVVTVPRSSTLEPKRLAVSSWLRGASSPGPYLTQAHALLTARAARSVRSTRSAITAPAAAGSAGRSATGQNQR